MTALDDFLWACVDEIGRRAKLANEAGAEIGETFDHGHLALRAALATPRPTRHAPRSSTTVPVVEHLTSAVESSAGWAAAAPMTTPQANLAAALPEIPWHTTPRLDDGGTEAALATLNIVRDLDGGEHGPVHAGLMLLAPGATYPRHSHPPQELYLPILGAGQWMYGGRADFRRLGPDALVYNHPNDAHSVIADDAGPLLALYTLWGPGAAEL